jgi:ComEC/Rec2-related protein
LLISDPSNQTRLVWPEAAVILAGLGILFILSPARLRIVVSCCIAFFIGIVWVSWLPTWPAPLDDTGNPSGPGCIIEGRAVSDAIDCPLGRFLPLSLKAIRIESSDSGSDDGNDGWAPARGVVLVRMSRYSVATPGAMYLARGHPTADLEQLHGPICLRYRARAFFNPDSERNCVVKIEDPPPTSAALNALRYHLASHLSWSLEDSEGELVAGITFGRRGRRLSGDWTKDFYSAGLSHLIVASGAQLSLLFMPILLLLSRVRIHRVARGVLLGLLGTLLVGFAKLLGGEPSIIRACVMGCVMLLSMGLGRRTFGLSSLSAAGWFWLIQNPLLSRDTGFMLSLGASFGIIYFTPPVIEAWTRHTPLPPFSSIRAPRGIVGMGVHSVRTTVRFIVFCSITTLSAQMGVLPILAMMAGRLSPAGFLANLLAVPLGQFVLLLGALSGLAGFACPAFSLGINKILEWPTCALMAVAHDFARLPALDAKTHPLPSWSAILYYAVLVTLVEYWRYRRMLRLTKPVKSTETRPAKSTEMEIEAQEKTGP